jgi:hypothetical protein
VEYLQEHGEIHRVVYSDFRRVLLRPFPYALYYSYHDELMVVTLVIHGHETFATSDHYCTEGECESASPGIGLFALDGGSAGAQGRRDACPTF